MALDIQLATKLAFILGITNIASIFLVLTSCRCMGLAKLTNKFFQYSWYQKYYRHHCLYWWTFIISATAHAILGFYIFGNPL